MTRSSVPVTVVPGMLVPGIVIYPDSLPTTHVCVGGTGGVGGMVTVFLSSHGGRVIIYCEYEVD